MVHLEKVFSLLILGMISWICYEQLILRRNHYRFSPERNIQDRILSTFVRNDNYQFPERKPILQVDCNATLKGNKNAIEYTVKITLANVTGNLTYSPEMLIQKTKDCKSFRRERGYVMNVLSPEEKEFPVAYSIISHKDPGQVERLLRAIYRPQNIYCIHVDAKANFSIHNAMESLSECFSNVFMASNIIEVRWGKFSVLQAQMICLEDLLKKSKKWKYLINLTGQDFPFKTNLEIVRSLKNLNGTNDVAGSFRRHDDTQRKRWERAGKPPHGIAPIKGAIHVAITRDFASFLLNDNRAKDFLTWLHKTLVPDETFFSSMNYNKHLQAPGRFNGTFEEMEKRQLLSKYVNWARKPWPCHGKYVRNICVPGVKDLPILASRQELFINKLYYDYQPFTLNCLEELIYNKTREEYLTQSKS